MSPIGSVRATMLHDLDDELIIDNFEDAPDGPFESGDDLDTYYTIVGESSHKWERDSGSVQGATSLRGQYALALTSGGNGSSNWRNMFSLPGDGLPNYPNPGDTVRCLIQNPGDDKDPAFYANVESNGDCFSIGMHNGLSELEIHSFNADSNNDSDNNQLASTNISISSSTWYWLEIHTASSDNNVEASLYDVELEENSLVRGSHHGTVEADDRHTGRGIGFGYSSRSNTGIMFDEVAILP